jgi:hypothetical protein
MSLNLQEIFLALGQGRKIVNTQNQFVYYVKDNHLEFRSINPEQEYTSDNKIHDFLKDSYELYIPPPVTMSFAEALQAMNEGKYVRRQSWKSDVASIRLCGELYVHGNWGCGYLPNRSEYAATDWIIG